MARNIAPKASLRSQTVSRKFRLAILPHYERHDTEGRPDFRSQATDVASS